VPLLSVGLVAAAIFGVQWLRSGGGGSGGGILVGATNADGTFTSLSLGAEGAGNTKLGEPAPGFVLTDPAGNVVRLADLKGKPVLINFWATWCAPCRREIPDLVALQQSWGSDVQVVGIDLQETADVVSEYARTMGMNYPLPLDLDGSVTASYKLTGLPETFALDANGIVRDHRIGILKPAVARCIVTGIERDGHRPQDCQ
jgi:thiol-disulfide isomerase/thioredoxin